MNEKGREITSMLEREFSEMGYKDAKKKASYYRTRIECSLKKQMTEKEIIDSIVEKYLSRYLNYVDIFDSVPFAKYLKKRGLSITQLEQKIAGWDESCGAWDRYDDVVRYIKMNDGVPGTAQKVQQGTFVYERRGK